VRGRVPRRVHRPARLHAGQSSRIPGVTCTKPEGAFYVYPNISAYLGKGGIKTATELATRLLHEAHVVTVPGEAFGTGEHIRISYPVTKQNIDEGTRRMGEFLTGSTCATSPW
jgi:aspartate aminotransferase